MTVDITQDELNILNLNGLSTDDVRDNINYLRMTGYDDAQIQAQYSELIDDLKPSTPVNNNDTQNILNWSQKGGIAKN